MLVLFTLTGCATTPQDTAATRAVLREWITPLKSCNGSMTISGGLAAGIGGTGELKLDCQNFKVTRGTEPPEPEPAAKEKAP
jgi:hypothetical protein